jgi:DNA-binding GntR family transcriptional regulator
MGTGKPLYLQVAESILQDISEKLQAGDRLPPEQGLCKQYSVGRNTVRRALSILADKGVVKTVPAVATFVAEPPVRQSAEFLYGFSQEMALHGHKVESQVLDAKLIPAEQEIGAELATPKVAELLRLTPPAVVLVFRRETQANDGTVIEYVESEFRADLFRFYTNLKTSAASRMPAFRRLPVSSVGSGKE